MINVSKLTFNLTSKGIGASGIWNIYANKFLIKHKYTNFYSKISAVKYSKMTTCCPSAKYEPTALVMLPTGAEELEFVAVVDVLRRGKVEVTICGLDTPEIVKCRSGTMIKPDTDVACICNTSYGAVVIPGGLEGARLLSESKAFGNLLKDQEKSKGLIAAICAGPTVLKAHQICPGYNVTCYPSVADKMCAGNLYKYHDNRPVVKDKNLITSRGPATAMNFAFVILGELMGDQVAKEVGDAMLFDYCATKVMQRV